MRAIELEDRKMGKSLYYKVRGVPMRRSSPIEPNLLVKETTFIQFLAEEERVLDMTQLTKRVVAILKKPRDCARTVTLKIRYDNFEDLSASTIH